MASRKTKERLQQEVALWFMDGIIEKQTVNILYTRYEALHFGWIGVVKYLGIAGGLLAFFGLLGMIAAATGSTGFAAVMQGGIGAGLTYWGLRLAGNVQDRYATSAKVIVTLGVVMMTGAIGLLSSAIGLKDEAILCWTGSISLPLVFFLAYYSRNTYLLMLTLLGMFHWIGAWHEMWGRSSYVFAVQDPYIMAMAAALAIAVGMVHERYLYPRTGKFYLAWESLGLVYLNMSLLMLSIWTRHAEATLLWIIIFTGACLAQIVLGAAWQNGLFRNFGITFLVIDICTRYHELFWDKLDVGLYLAGGGVWLLVLGGGTEAITRVLRTKGAAR